MHEENALALWCIIGLGFALGLFPRAAPRRSVTVPLVAFVLFALWSGLSLAWSESDERTFVELGRALEYLGVLVLVWSCIGRRTWRAAAVGVVIAALAVCVLALVSRLDPGSLGTDYIGAVFRSNRLSYPFNYWNAVSAWAVMSIAMAVVVSAHVRQLAFRAVCLALVPTCAVAAYLTYSRQAIGGIAVALILGLVLARNRWTFAIHAFASGACAAIAIAVTRAQPQIVQATGGAGAAKVAIAVVVGGAVSAWVSIVTWRLGMDRLRLPQPAGRVAAASGLAAVLLLAAVPARDTVSKAWDEFRNQPAGPAASTSDPAARLTNFGGTRYEQWTSAFKAFRAHPGDGTGAGTFEFWWSAHGGHEFIRDVHSVYLEQLAELGLPGFVLVVIVFASMAWLGVKARIASADPTSAGLVGGLMAAFGAYLFHAGVDWMWEVPAVTVLALGSAAVAIASRSGPPRMLWWPLRAAITVPAIFAALTQLPPLVATSEIRESQIAFRQNNLPSAIDHANKAVEAEPWAASPYVQRGLLAEATGDLGAARADIERARMREPTNWRHPLLLARIDAERGDVGGALVDYRRARSLRPASAFVSRP